MKSKIISYSGVNKAVVDGGKQLLTVKIPVNSEHPKVGEDLEFEAKQIVCRENKQEEKPAKGGEEKPPEK